MQISPSQTVKRDLVVSGVYDSRYFAKSQPELVFRPVAKLRFGEYLIRTAVPASISPIRFGESCERSFR